MKGQRWLLSLLVGQTSIVNLSDLYPGGLVRRNRHPSFTVSKLLRAGLLTLVRTDGISLGIPPALKWLGL